MCVVLSYNSAETCMEDGTQWHIGTGTWETFYWSHQSAQGKAGMHQSSTNYLPIVICLTEPVDHTTIYTQVPQHHEQLPTIVKTMRGVK